MEVRGLADELREGDELVNEVKSVCEDAEEDEDDFELLANGDEGDNVLVSTVKTVTV